MLCHDLGAGAKRGTCTHQLGDLRGALSHMLGDAVGALQAACTVADMPCWGAIARRSDAVDPKQMRWSSVQLLGDSPHVRRR